MNIKDLKKIATASELVLINKVEDLVNKEAREIVLMDLHNAIRDAGIPYYADEPAYRMQLQTWIESIYKKVREK